MVFNPAAQLKVVMDLLPKSEMLRSEKMSRMLSTMHVAAA